MLKKLLTLFLMIFLISGLSAAAKTTAQKAKVTKVLSGTTVEVDINGKIEKVRLIGVGLITVIDGKKISDTENEAKLFIKTHLEGKPVSLRKEDKIPDRDKEGYLLRHIYFSKRKYFNLFMVKQGYALTDTTYSFSRIADFKEQEKKSKAAKLGFWGFASLKQTASGDTVVYITKSGTKYHKMGCVRLKKGGTAIKLKEARAKGYLPCKLCKPPA